MGKIRVKILGDEDLEKEQKKEARLDREARQAKKRQEAKKEAKVGLVEKPEEVSPSSQVAGQSEAETMNPGMVGRAKKASQKSHKTHKTHKSHRSKKYQVLAKLVDKNKFYSLSDALELLPKLKIANFDETVELHMNTAESGMSGNLSLPHGTGKKTKVAIADEKLIAEIEKGKIDFDVLLATPQMMPKLAKVARILGPKGLMPNPKNGTISPKPEDLIKKYEQGQISFKTEAKIPIIHLSVGKLSYGGKKLSENIKTALNTIQINKIRKVVLKSTMSPGIKINYNSL